MHMKKPGGPGSGPRATRGRPCPIPMFKLKRHLTDVQSMVNVFTLNFFSYCMHVRWLPTNQTLLLANVFFCGSVFCWSMHADGMLAGTSRHMHSQNVLLVPQTTIKCAHRSCRCQMSPRRAKNKFPTLNLTLVVA